MQTALFHEIAILLQTLIVCAILFGGLGTYVVLKINLDLKAAVRESGKKKEHTDELIQASYDTSIELLKEIRDLQNRI